MQAQLESLLGHETASEQNLPGNQRKHYRERRAYKAKLRNRSYAQGSKDYGKRPG